MKISVGNRVLMLLENNPYPQDLRVRREAETLALAGYQLSVICPKEPGLPWYEVIDGVQVYRFPMSFTANGFLGYIWEYGYSLVIMFILSLIVFLGDGFDIIHTHNPPDTLVLIAGVYKLLGKCFIYDHHDLSPEMYYARFGGHGNSFVYRVLVWMEKLSCRLADHIITTNQSYRAIEMERSHIPEKRITIVRNGPDLNFFGPVEPDPTLRQKGKTIIGYAGVMGFQDGVDYLLRALRHLVYGLGRTDFYCVIIGDGDACSSLKDLAAQLGLNDYIWFTGWASSADYVRYLSTVDICVDPGPSNSYNDRSTTIKIMEYMALGKPIVAFDLAEHRFTAQKAALYVRPNDEFEMAQAIAQLMDDTTRRQVMGSFGRRRVETELAWHYSAPYLLKVYHSLSSELRDKR